MSSAFDLIRKELMRMRRLQAVRVPVTDAGDGQKHERRLG